MNDDRAYRGRLSDQTAYPFAAIVVLTLAAVIGVGVMTNEGAGSTIPPASNARARIVPSTRPTVAPTVTPKLRIALAPTLKPSLFRGLIGLPPEDAEPSSPLVGELVDSYWVAGGGLPYRGTARLYADGRLIWNRYYDGPRGHNAHTTGYIEQRLSPDGVELVRSHENLSEKDPLRLPQWLPLGSWEDRTARTYVPSGYGICLHAMDPRPGRADDAISNEPAELLTMLPPPISRLLQGHEFVSPMDRDQECIALTLEETRVLERVLRDGDFDQEAFINGFMVQYAVDVPGAYGTQVWLVFEPRFPDGSIGCSACG